jgi:hypothetical protein
MQPTRTRRGIGIEGVAKACNFPSAETVYTNTELAKAVPDILSGKGLLFRDIKVNTTRCPLSIYPHNGAHIKHRFPITFSAERSSTEEDCRAAAGMFQAGHEALRSRGDI